MKKTVVTVVGKDSVGIIAKVCTYLANIVDVAACSKDFETFSHELEQIGGEMNCIIKAQREDIFDSMHRL